MPVPENGISLPKSANISDSSYTSFYIFGLKLVLAKFQYEITFFMKKRCGQVWTFFL